MRRERLSQKSIVAVLVALVVAGTTAVVAVPPVAALPNNTISGVVTDGDVGVPASGLEVRLYREPGRVVVGNRTTAADGSYSFSGLEDGSYRLRFADPTTGTFGTEFFADKGVYSAATAVNVAGGASTTANATVTRPTQIAGVVRDADTASPVPGIEVRLYREPGRVFVANRTTAADGSYVFADPGAGTYRLRFQDPAGVYVTEFHADMPYYSKASDVVVAPGASVAVDAAISAPTSISGAVSDDLTGLPVPGIEVRLYREPGRVVVANTTTAANGSYAFANPGAGTYRLRFQDPAGRYVTEFFDGASTYSPGTDIVLPVGGDAVASAALARPEATYVVNTSADGGDAAVDGVCEMTPALGDCSLRAAFDEANAHPGHDVVQIAGGVHPVLALPGVGEDANAAGDLDVTADVDLAGGGATIDGGGLDRVLHVHGGASVTATDLTVTGGYLDDPASVYGGGVLTEGELTLERVVVTGNEIADPGWSFGGGVASLGYEPGAGLVVIDSTIAANEAAHGAGVTVQTGTFSVSRSSIVDNVPHGNLAGGVALIGTTGTIDRSTVARNGSATAVFVGADPDLDNPVASDVSIRQSTVEGQSAAIHNVRSMVDLVASTIVGLPGWHGGFAVVAEESAVETTGSILDGDGGSCFLYSASVTSGGWNVAGDASCALTSVGDQQGVDPLLDVLGDNGGPTWTRRPADGSPAIDAVPIGTVGLCDGALPTDQRGVARPQGGGCDIGAVDR